MAACAERFVKLILADDDDEPAWMVEYAREQRRRALFRERKDLEVRLAKVRAREKRQQEHYESGEPRFKRLVGPSVPRQLFSCVWTDVSRK